MYRCGYRQEEKRRGRGEEEGREKQSSRIGK
jgi:hypothetical protein